MAKTIVSNAKAAVALQYLIPVLHNYDFKWVITGGFACYVYGVDRLLTDIDIDIDTSIHDAKFQEFLAEVEPYISQPLMNYVDDNYNNYNFELTYEGQIVDICPMKELLIYDNATSEYQNFYNDFPAIEMTEFEGLMLPLMSKQLILANKLALANKDKWQLRDIAELKKLL